MPLGGGGDDVIACDVIAFDVSDEIIGHVTYEVIWTLLDLPAFGRHSGVIHHHRHTMGVLGARNILLAALCCKNILMYLKGVGALQKFLRC